MFKERDRRCAAVQPMLSTDPSYDKRTIASTLIMQIRTFQHAQGDENKVSGYDYGLWCGFKWGRHHATSHHRSRLESQHQSLPGCAEERGDPLVQSGGRWQNLDVAAGLGASPQVQRDPGLASEGVLRLRTLLSPPAFVEKAFSQFRIRIEAVIEADGGFIEYMSALLHNQVTWFAFINKSFKIKL